MRERVSKVKTDDVGHNIYKTSHTSVKRLNLNDLLRRAAIEKNRSKKTNILIFSGAASALVMFFLFLSL